MAEGGPERDAGRQARDERLAAALRANLHRRKARARALEQERPAGSGVPPSPAGTGSDPRQD